MYSAVAGSKVTKGHHFRLEIVHRESIDILQTLECQSFCFWVTLQTVVFIYFEEVMYILTQQIATNVLKAFIRNGLY